MRPLQAKSLFTTDPYCPARSYVVGRRYAVFHFNLWAFYHWKRAEKEKVCCKKKLAANVTATVLAKYATGQTPPLLVC